MYLCNLLENSGSVINRKSKTFKQIINIPADSAEGYIDVVDDKLAFVEGEGYGIFSINPEVEENMDSENSLIWVLSKDIIFYEGIKAYIKFINVSEDVILSCLVSGACGYTSITGEKVTLTRGETLIPGQNPKYRVFTGKTLKEIAVSKDRETGYDMCNDVVNAIIVSIARSNKGELNASYKKVKEGVVIFDNTGLKAAQAKALEKKQKEEERQRIMAQKAEEARIKAEEARQAEVKKQFETASAGAKNFLEQLKAMKANRA